MGLLPWVWYGGRAEGGLKFLLRTGPQATIPDDDFNTFLWFVGGDRPTPTLIDKSVLTIGTQWSPISIVATGPGLDDWVMCAVDEQGFGGRVAFINSEGLIKIDTVAVPPMGFVSTNSTGNFASRVAGAGNIAPTTSWVSTTASGGGAPLGNRNASEGFYFLPDVVRNVEQGIISSNTKRQATANAELTYSLRSPNNISNQTLYRANGSRTTLTTPIVPDPAAGLTGNVTSLQMFDQACSLINMELWRWTGLTPTPLLQTTTQQATLTADRWQLYDDATWDYLPRLPVSYYLNAGLVRVDMSGWIEP